MTDNKDDSKLEANVNEMFAKLLSQKSLTNVKIFKQIGNRLDKVVKEIEWLTMKFNTKICGWYPVSSIPSGVWVCAVTEV